MIYIAHGNSGLRIRVDQDPDSAFKKNGSFYEKTGTDPRKKPWIRLNST